MAADATRHVPAAANVDGEALLVWDALTESIVIARGDVLHIRHRTPTEE